MAIVPRVSVGSYAVPSSRAVLEGRVDCWIRASLFDTGPSKVGNLGHVLKHEDVIEVQVVVAEFRVRVAQVRALAELSVEIEPFPDCADPRALARRLEIAFDNAFALRVPVTPVDPGTLPRFEMKARRWVKD